MLEFQCFSEGAGGPNGERVLFDPSDVVFLTEKRLFDARYLDVGLRHGHVVTISNNNFEASAAIRKAKEKAIAVSWIGCSGPEDSGAEPEQEPEPVELGIYLVNKEQYVRAGSLTEAYDLYVASTEEKPDSVIEIAEPGTVL